MHQLKNQLYFLVLLVAGVISVFAFAPFNHGLCIVISLFTLLWYISRSTLRRSIVEVLVYGIGFFLSQLYWMFYSLYYVIDIGFINAALGVGGFTLYLSCYPIIAVVLFKKAQTKSQEFNYLFLFPSVWVLAEWLRGWAFTGFSWSDIAYTQVNNYLLQGFFPLIGSYGVSWLTLSIFGFLYLVIINNKILLTGAPRITGGQRAAIVYFVILAISGYYLHGKQYTTSYGKPVKVALVQGNINGAEKWDSQKFLNHLDMYSRMISQSKADIIFLPETAIAMYESNLPAHYVDDITNFAKLNHADLVIGLPRQINARGDYVNSATVFTKPGHPYYAKAHLVPFGEYIPLKDLWGPLYIFAGIPMVGFNPGSFDQVPLVLANQKVAFNICYENGFGSELIKAAREATLMANLSDMVWYGKSIAKDQHLELSQARAMENQRYFIQDTNTGLTAVINPMGQIEARLPDFTQDTLISYVEGHVGVTPYERYGNYLIIIFACLILLTAALSRLLAKKQL